MRFKKPLIFLVALIPAIRINLTSNVVSSDHHDATEPQ